MPLWCNWCISQASNPKPQGDDFSGCIFSMSPETTRLPVKNLQTSWTGGVVWCLSLWWIDTAVSWINPRFVWNSPLKTQRKNLRLSLVLRSNDTHDNSSKPLPDRHCLVFAHWLTHSIFVPSLVDDPDVRAPHVGKRYTLGNCWFVETWRVLWVSDLYADLLLIIIVGETSCCQKIESSCILLILQAYHLK